MPSAEEFRVADSTAPPKWLDDSVEWQSTRFCAIFLDVQSVSVSYSYEPKRYNCRFSKEISFYFSDDFELFCGRLSSADPQALVLPFFGTRFI
jgi:hypothetical protein